MKIKLTNISGYHSKVINEDGNSIKVDNKSIDNPQGVSPMELLLMGVAGCCSIDIISILKKQKQHFKDLTIEVEGQREKVDLANLFKKKISFCSECCLQGRAQLKQIKTSWKIFRLRLLVKHAR